MKDFFPVGVVCKVVKIIRIPGTVPVAFLLSGERARLRKIVKKTPVLIGAVDPLDVIDCSTFGTEEEVLLENINNTFAQILNYISEQERNRISFSVEEMDKFVDRKIYFMANNSPLQVDDKARLLECGDIKNLLETFLKMLDMALQKLEIQAAIHMRTHEDLNRQQREHFLQQQIKAIQDEWATIPKAPMKTSS